MPSPSLGVPAVWRCRAVSTFWAGTSFRCPCLAPPTVGSTAGFSLMFTVRAWSIPWQLTKLVCRKRTSGRPSIRACFSSLLEPGVRGSG